MAVKLKIPTSRRRGKRAKSRLLSRDPVVRFALLGFISLSLLVIGFFAYWYEDFCGTAGGKDRDQADRF
jgi:hypothetical protein